MAELEQALLGLLSYGVPSALFLQCLSDRGEIQCLILFLLAAGELSVLLLAQNPRLRRLLRSRAEQEWTRDQERLENQIFAGLPDNYKKDFNPIKQLCLEIERRAAEMENDKTSGPLVEEIVEKLVAFRFEYIRMLRAHSLLANRDYLDMQRRLEDECKTLQDSAGREQSGQVRTTIDQNVKILRQRVAKLHQLSEIVRLIEARLQVVSNSLQLIQDEVYSMTDVRGISSVVDELLVNLELNDEMRSVYGDVLSEQESTLSALASLDVMEGQSRASSRPRQTI